MAAAWRIQVTPAADGVRRRIAASQMRPDCGDSGLQTPFYSPPSRRMNFSRSPVDPAETVAEFIALAQTQQPRT